MMPDPWSSLDDVAEANFSGNPDAMQRFKEYRDQLRADGHAWTDDAECILRGFIWDETEESPDED